MHAARVPRDRIATLCAALAWALVSAPAVLAEDTQDPVDSRQAALPTDRFTQDAIHTPTELPTFQAPGSGTSRVWEPMPLPESEPWYHSLLFNVSAEWEPEASGITIFDYDLGTQIPLYPSTRNPPPLVAFGFSFTDLDAPAAADLPSELYDAALGLRWLRQLNERWLIRATIDAAFASDTHNTSSDAWQMRGGVYAVYGGYREPKWMFGAVATGRRDIPVLPAAGVMWQPMDRLQVDLILPQPRVSYLLADHGDRQDWLYTGAAITGGMWAYERAVAGTDELLTYREWRMVLGWESKGPPNPPGVFGPTGVRFGAEVGYVFGRKFEFDSGAPDIEPDGTLLLRAFVSQ